MALIQLRNLSFSYALNTAESLRGINLTIEQGEFVVLCGPSGCGKTTLLRHLKQELLPAGRRSGEVIYDGLPMGSLPALRSACETGMVMQDPDSQIVTDVVWHELAFGLENLGFDSGTIHRRVAEMASFFGIGGWFHQKTGALSGGQKQMLNLASILTMQPRLLLLDEPTAMLDPVAAREFVEMAARLNREFGITVLLSCHRLEEVFHLATRVLFLEDGEVRYFGAPGRIGGFLKNNKKYLRMMPAAMRIAAALEGELPEPCPITVNDGKAYLAAKRSRRPEAPQSHDAQPPEKAAPKTGEPLLECKNIYFHYEKDAPDILRGLSMKARTGELCCILGENGSGKSTLLGLLAGLSRPSHGTVLVGGQSAAKLGARALYLSNVALLPQNPKALFVCDKLFGDLQAAAEISGANEADIRRATEKLGLAGLLDRHPYDLSGGEQRRAALAKLLLMRPRILLLDEPTCGLDAIAGESLGALLRGFCGDGVCIVVITHDIEFAARHADRCMLLFDGAIASEGAPRRFFGGNCFYTTAANRIARDFDPGAVTCEDVIARCQNA